MKILELTTYSAGICGVFARVKEEAKRLSDLGHEVKIFSTNHTKGSASIAPKTERIGKVEITRFPAKKLGGESFTYWNFEKEALRFSPDIIIAHVYRHIHTIQALRIAKMNFPVILVTHAPFQSGKENRSLPARLAVKFYDIFIGRLTLKKFSKIIIISLWEKPFLKVLGVPESKIEYIPNGIPELFFTQQPKKEEKKILYFGRISPVKDLETLIIAFSKMKDKSFLLEIAGPSEQGYLNSLKSLVLGLRLKKRVIFTSAISDIKKKIEKYDSAFVYVLPSKREGMPQSLIEAMARKKTVIASNNSGSKDLIQHNKNGFLFSIGDSDCLSLLLDNAVSSKNNKIKNSAFNSVNHFAWPILIKKLNYLIKKTAKSGIQ